MSEGFETFADIRKDFANDPTTFMAESESYVLVRPAGSQWEIIPKLDEVPSRLWLAYHLRFGIRGVMPYSDVLLNHANRSWWIRPLGLLLFSIGALLMVLSAINSGASESFDHPQSGLFPIWGPVLITVAVPLGIVAFRAGKRWGKKNASKNYDFADDPYAFKLAAAHARLFNRTKSD